MKTLTTVFVLLTLSSKLATAQVTSKTNPPATAAPSTASPSAAPPATATQTQAHVFEGATPNPKGFTAWGALPWGGYGFGGRFMMPLAISPLLNSSSVRDSWALEFGVDYLRLGDNYGTIDIHYNEILPVVGIMWDFWFSQRFAIYPKAELGYAFAWFSNSYGSGIPAYGGVFVSGAAGVMFRLDSGLTLRAEAGISGLKAGVAWLF